MDLVGPESLGLILRSIEWHKHGGESCKVAGTVPSKCRPESPLSLSFLVIRLTFINRWSVCLAYCKADVKLTSLIVQNQLHDLQLLLYSSPQKMFINAEKMQTFMNISCPKDTLSSLLLFFLVVPAICGTLLFALSCDCFISIFQMHPGAFPESLPASYQSSKAFALPSQTMGVENTSHCCERICSIRLLCPVRWICWTYLSLKL